MEEPETYGPLDFLTPDAFDPELQTLIAEILRESRSEARIRPALAAQVRQIRGERARALRHYRAHRAETSHIISPSTIAHWRDGRTAVAQAEDCFRDGLEVGAWVMTLASGRRTILPVFSDAGARAHCQPDVYQPLRDFVDDLPAGDVVHSAALFHNHPGGHPLPSIMDFEGTEALARMFPGVREFHIYAIADANGRVRLGHYGVSR